MSQARRLAVAAWVGAALSGTVALAEEPRDDAVHLDADIVTLRGDREPASGPDVVAEGNVHLRRGALELRAPRLEIDRARRSGLLSGGVVGLDGRVVFFARSLRFDDTTGLQTLEGGTILVKKGLEGPALREGFDSADPGCVRGLGQNALTLRATEIRRERGGELDATGVWFTTCACGENCRPLLAVSAANAHVVPNDRASFWWPTLRLFDVPVLPLPWISLPLRNRQTGLLFPIVAFNGPGGINVGAPVFITLGESADLTLEPLYYFGTTNADVGGTGPDSTGVRGFGGDAEFRWRPAADAAGSLHVLYLYDWSKGTTGTGVRGNRGFLDATHAQGLLGGRFATALNLASDSDFRADTAVAVPLRYEPYLRSSVQYTRTLGPVGLSFESLYLENLQPEPYGQGPAIHPRTPLGQIPGVIAPVARLNLGGSTHLGRLMMDEQAEVSAEDAWRGLPPGTHSRRLSASAALAQTLPLVGGEYGALSLDAGERAQWLGLPGRNGQDWRAGGYLGLFGRTRIARTFESGWVHDFVPGLRVRGLGGAGSVPFSRGVDAALFDATGPTARPQSGWDLALPATPTIQAIASLSTSLTPPRGQPMTLFLEQHLAALPFDAGQLRAGLDIPWGANQLKLSGGRVFSPGLAGWGPAGIEYHRDLAAAGDLLLRFSFSDGRTDDQIARGPDLLFTPLSEVPATSGTHPPQSSYQAHAGLFLRRLGPVDLLLQGDVTVYPHASQYLVQDYKAVLSYAVEGCGLVRLTIGWTWAAQVGAQQPLPLPLPTPEYVPGDAAEVARGVSSAFDRE